MKLRLFLLYLILALVSLDSAAFYKIEGNVYYDVKEICIENLHKNRKLPGIKDGMVQDSTFIAATLCIKSDNTIRYIEFLVVTHKNGLFRSPIMLENRELSACLMPVPDELLSILKVQFDNIHFWYANAKTDILSLGIPTPIGEIFLTIRYVLIPIKSD